jgi:indole-3-glycerol phosphate synthase
VDILSKIIEAKRKRLEISRRAVPIRDLRERGYAARDSVSAHRLLERLRENRQINIIAEFKRRSPSKGLIRVDVSAPEMVRMYETGGAAAISVLTEEDHFEGSLDDLLTIKKEVSLPILRKDFVVDEYQVFESAIAGADAVLLIVAALDDPCLQRLRSLAEEELRMDALVEVHSAEELSRAEGSGAKMIGVNNRDLKTFNVSLNTSVELAAIAPAGCTLVAESGLHSYADVRRLHELGFSGFLIGETLMKADHPDSALRQLMSGI